MNPNFCFIGAGNLATHLSKRLLNMGFSIIQVFSRTETSARTLAGVLGCSFTTVPENITPDADVYIIAISDSAFSEVLARINFHDRLVAHTSGSQPLSVLAGCSANYGVLYPLQTFSKNREVNFHTTPVFVEANNGRNEETLLHIAGKLSSTVSVCSSEKRKYLHIAAVFACNFVNHLYTVAAELLKTKDIPFDVLKPLILETALKAGELKPENAQTGPAVRYDKNIISQHLEELKSCDNYAELYELLSKSIFKHHL